jgi:hypothetical protein
MDAKGDRLHRQNINVAVAAAVTAYARLHINRFKNLPGVEVYYTDTDSLVCSSPLPSEVVGGALGQFKLERMVARGYFIGPKCYMEIGVNGESLIKVKG